MRKKWIIGTLCSAGIVLAGCSKVDNLTTTTINLNDYVTIEVSGYDGYGKARCVIDKTRLNEDYGGKLVTTEKKIQKAAGESEYISSALGRYDNNVDVYLQYLDGRSVSDILGDFYTLDVDVKDGISNSNVITCSFSEGENADIYSELYNAEFIAEDFSITVDSLEELGEFDAFDGFEISYTGESPNASASVKSKGSADACADLVYTIKPDGSLSNGSKVTVSITPDPQVFGDGDWEDIVNKYGMLPKETSKTFTVSGLDAYATSTDQIPVDTIQLLDDQAESVFVETVEDGLQDDTQELLNFQYVGNIFMAPKENADENQIYMIYKVRVNNFYACETKINNQTVLEDYDEDTDFYWYCSFGDILVDEDGGCSVNSLHYSTPVKNPLDISSGIPSTETNKKSWRFYGFKTLSDTYEAITDGKDDTWNIENSAVDIDFDTDPDAAGTESTETESGGVTGDTDNTKAAQTENTGSDTKSKTN